MKKESSKPPKEPKEKTIHNSNFFVMERPSELNAHSLIIKTDEYHQEESKLDELLTDAFYDVVLNVSDRLSFENYKHALKIITPSLALQIFSENEGKMEEIVKNFLTKEKNKKVLEFFESIPEDVSKLEFVIRLNFVLFYQDKTQKSLDEAIKNFKFFLDDMEEIFYYLPVCYAFNLIDFLHETETSAKKTKRQK